MKWLFLISASFILACSVFGQSKCVTAPVNITGRQAVITSSGEKSVSNQKNYVYYICKHYKKSDEAYPPSAINDHHQSKPILLSNDKIVKAVPETYNVTLNTQQSSVAVCPDSMLNVNADVNVEKVSSYTGNYPDNNNVYSRVTKRQYKMVDRKLRKIRRDEAKITRETCIEVSARTN